MIKQSQLFFAVAVLLAAPRMTPWFADALTASILAAGWLSVWRGK